MNPTRFVLGDREITTIGNIMVSSRPADTTAKHAADLLTACEKREEKGFVSGFYDLGFLMEALRELDQDIPIEISLSVETVGGRARLLKIVHDNTTTYLAGRTLIRASDPFPEPDALTEILRENEILRERIAELELRSGGLA